MAISEYSGVLLYFCMMAGTALLMMLVSHLCSIRVKKDTYDWTRPYECGIRTEGLPISRFPIHYYIVAIMFVIFDVETVFLVPWAVIAHDFKARDGHVFWFTEMLIFMVILIIGFIYLLQNKVFNWGQEESIEG